MTYRLEFRPEASADVAEAFSWYEAQRPGLGAEFEAELDHTLRLITTMPAMGRIVHRISGVLPFVGFRSRSTTP